MIDLSNRDLLQRLRNRSEILEFVMTLKPDERESLAMMMSWPPSMLSRFRDQPEHLGILHKVWDLVPDREAFLRVYLSAFDDPAAKGVNILDAFSRGQLDSKNWLVDRVSELGIDLGRVWILGGWVGVLAHLMFINGHRIRFGSIRSFDIDIRCARLAETMNRPQVMDGWRFKATTMDANDLVYDGMVYDTERYDGSRQRLIESADTVINTSCDHMGNDDSWFNRIPAGRLIILQNNDWDDNDQHDNSVASADELMDRYPLASVLYHGELDCGLYRRFMVIGRKG